MAEIVMIASDEAAAARFAEQLGGAQTQGRVVITSAPANGPRPGPGVRAFSAEHRPEAADLADLSAAERLFVDAWQARLDGAMTKKVRRGDGRSWDSPGFQPPDPPYHDDG